MKDPIQNKQHILETSLISWPSDLRVWDKKQ